MVEGGGSLESFAQLGEAQRVRLSRHLDREAHGNEEILNRSF